MDVIDHEGSTALHSAVTYDDHVSTMLLLLSYGACADANSVGKTGETLLCIATDGGFDEVVEALLEHRA